MTILIVIASIFGYIVIAGAYYSFCKKWVPQYDSVDHFIVASIWPVMLCIYLLCLPWTLGNKIYAYFGK